MPTSPPSPAPPDLRVPIDPRIRRRRIEVRRSEGRRRLRLILIGLTIAAVTAGVWFGVRSPLLDVDRLKVVGADRTTAEAVVAAAGVERGRPMVDVEVEAVARAVENLPWVHTASARRLWPATVEVTVTERRPVAVTSADGESWAVLDASGRVLERRSNRPPELMLLEGTGPAPEPGETLVAADGLLDVFAAMSPELAARTAAIAAVDGGQVELRLNPRGTVRLGPPHQLDAKVEAAETMLASVDLRNLAILDVRLPSSPVLTRG